MNLLWDEKNGIIFSIIIPVTRDFELKKLLHCLAKQNFDLNRIEVILIYEQSKTASFSYPFNIRVLVSNKKHPGVKRNIGCRVARGRYLVFLDDDCFPPNHWLSTGFNLLKKYKVVSSPCNTGEKDFGKRLSRAITSSFFGSGTRMCCNYKGCEVPFYNVGLFNVFMHKHIWKMAGGFNEDANYLMDDKEFFYLLSLRNIKFYNSPDLIVSHSARKFPWEYLRNSLTVKFQTGINYFVYNEIFRKQPVFYFIYSAYLVIPLLFLFFWKSFYLLLIFYYLLCSVVYRSYLKQDYRIYLCLAPGIILTNIVMLIGVFCGSVYFLLRSDKFKHELVAKRERITKVLNEKP